MSFAGELIAISLEFLSLTNNQFTGSIVAVGNLCKFKSLDLSNQFSGQIPISLFGFVGFSYMLLNRNQLSGPLIVKVEVTIKVVELNFNLLVRSVSFLG
jgi:Leucine-rich repeat (LRR) protein